MDRFFTACQVAKRTLETFVQHFSIGGQQQRFAFTKEILWLLSSESQILVMHGGKVLVERETHNDHHGYLSSMDMLDECRSLAAAYSITDESSASIVIKTTIFLDPAFESPENLLANERRPTNRKAVYSHPPEDWRTELLTEDAPPTYPRLRRVVLADEITWSSKDTPQQNASKASAFRERWAFEEVVDSVIA